MNIADLNGKHVCILGYGKEGMAMTDAIEKYAPECHITIADKNTAIDITNPKYKKQLGETWLTNLDTFDIIIKSPGIPPCLLPKTCTPITNANQIFLDSISQNTIVIGVTGSKGKSTMSSLITAILKAAKKDVSLIGNIGEAAISHINDGGLNKFFVQEFSSYQLMELTRSPHIAVVTSFFPEHLDYHGSLDMYKYAKTALCRYQSSNDIVFYNAHSVGAKEIAQTSKGKHVPYDESSSPIAIEDTKLIGNHNLVNIAGATAVARYLGIDDAIIIEAIRAFAGLPHRLQSLGMHRELEWIDDAISTTPESTIAAIQALSPRISTIILGGQDRGNDFTELGNLIDASNIKHVITMGQSGPRIAQTIHNPNITLHTAESIEQAVSIASNQRNNETTKQRQLVVLSPASPSYDLYKNFEEKGELFKKCIENDTF